MNFTHNNFGYQPAAIELKITNKINAYLYFMTVQIIWNEWEAPTGRKKIFIRNSNKSNTLHKK